MLPPLGGARSAHCRGQHIDAPLLKAVAQARRSDAAEQPIPAPRAGRSENHGAVTERGDCGHLPRFVLTTAMIRWRALLLMVVCTD